MTIKSLSERKTVLKNFLKKKKNTNMNITVEDNKVMFYTDVSVQVV